MPRPALIFMLALTLAACSREPRFEPIPEQMPPVEAPDPPSFPCFYSMSEPRTDKFIVHDIPHGVAGDRRWTAQNPAVRCTLPRGGSWQVAIDFIAIGETMRQTGPITLTFTVNGHEVARLRCEKDGERRFRTPLPAEFAQPGAEIVLQASVDRPYIAPGDGAKLGVMLLGMGLVQP